MAIPGTCLQRLATVPRQNPGIPDVFIISRAIEIEPFPIDPIALVRKTSNGWNAYQA